MFLRALPHKHGVWSFLRFVRMQTKISSVVSFKLTSQYIIIQHIKTLHYLKLFSRLLNQFCAFILESLHFFPPSVSPKFGVPKNTFNGTAKNRGINIYELENRAKYFKYNQKFCPAIDSSVVTMTATRDCLFSGL